MSNEGSPTENEPLPVQEAADESVSEAPASQEVMREITPEGVFSALKEGNLEPLREYRQALEEHYGETTAGRFDLEEAMITIYVAAGLLDEALDCVDAMLDMADGERDDANYERFRRLGEAISASFSAETPVDTPRSIN
jgi:hypothetical protein